MRSATGLPASAAETARSHRVTLVGRSMRSASVSQDASRHAQDNNEVGPSRYDTDGPTRTGTVKVACGGSVNRRGISDKHFPVLIVRGELAMRSGPRTASVSRS